MRAGKLRLTFTGDGAQPRVGDTVVTSGMNASHPRGLMIGTVTRVQPADNGLGTDAVIEPSVSINDLRQVFIVTGFSIVH
jgi:rod shape-determining protein MreC